MFALGIAEIIILGVFAIVAVAIIAGVIAVVGSATKKRNQD